MVGASFTVAAAAQVLRSKKGITAVGNAQVDTAQSKFGGSSALFDGTGDYLVPSPNTDLAFGTGDFTIEFWLRVTTVSGIKVIYDSRPYPTNGAYPVIYLDGSTLIYFVSSASRITTTIAANTWYHIAVSRSGTSTRLFVNGTQGGSTYTDTTNYSTGNVIIGADHTPGGNGVIGHMDEVRVSNSARYTTTFTPSTTPFVNDANTLLLIHADGTDGSTFFEDDNGIGRSPTPIIAQGTAAVSTAQSQFGGSSILVGSAGTNLNGIYVPTNADYFGTTSPTYPFVNWNSYAGGFTVELWVRYTSLDAIDDSGLSTIGIMDRGDYPAQWSFGSTRNGALSFEYYNGSTTPVLSSANSQIAINTWYHIAMVRNGTNIKIYLNGVEKGSATISGTPSVVARDLSIGSHYRVGSRSYVDEIRISSTARYTAGFTPSTTPFVNDANTLLLIHGDGTNGSTVVRDDNGALANRQPKYITAVGNAQVDTAQSKFGGASALFDGTDDYLRISQSSTLNLGTGDFTIEFWVRANALGANNCILTTGTSFAAGALGIAGGSSGNGMRYFDYNYNSSGSALVGDPTALTTGVWYHYAITRTGSSWKLYRDGTSVSTGTYAGAVNLAHTDTLIGAAGWDISNTDWNGWIDELRISNSVRYTSNFTPATTAFVNDANTLLLMHMDGVDASTQFFDDTANRTQKGISAIGNAQVDTAQSQFGGTSALFDGTGDALNISADSIFNFGTSDYTVECWIRSSSLAATRIIADLGQYTQNSRPVFYVSTDGKINIYTAATGAVSSAGSTILINTWYHVALVRSSGTTTIYVDGVSKASTATSYNMSTTAYLNVGAENVTTNSWNGWIDEFRVSNIARYTAAFTPSTTPFQNDANTLLLLHMDGTDASTAFFDDNGIAPYTP
jgi:hypothetical protein